jgi:hypothetical protein
MAAFHRQRDDDDPHGRRLEAQSMSGNFRVSRGIGEQAAGQSPAQKLEENAATSRKYAGLRYAR